MSSISTTPWLKVSKPKPAARLRLFCFPYAGGGAGIYQAWPNELPADVEVCAAQLPGRGARLKEPLFTHLKTLVEPLASAILPYLNKPFTFFGHSMGALIAFELARHLRNNKQMQPAHLFVSGRRAPQLPRVNPPIYDLPEPRFLEELKRINGTPAEVLAHPELMELMLPLLRADFSMVGTYEYTAEPPLDCPITAYGGIEDEEVSRQQLEGWRSQTTSDFRLRMLAGDHFYLQTARSTLLRSLSIDLHNTKTR